MRKYDFAHIVTTIIRILCLSSYSPSLPSPPPLPSLPPPSPSCTLIHVNAENSKLDSLSPQQYVYSISLIDNLPKM
jgi:hypothetical protein